ncbi:asparagine synthase C-terminal domain-containing protein [Candidatus Nitrosotenuis chungbukensis]|uniref:asparagine synthase C-terminal domain-containing protein n=1 Tax=Candidatus Nitrosotenuis chungbukensis TaxID=1353246 RepID=UPI0005B257E6|nr:asparagine synthase C-terminal domain-containing protein [Candidatus Nitrosotenuis chungbukensis]
MPDTDTLLEQIKKAVLHTVLTQKIGVAFSGGVDSTLVAKVCSDLGYDVTLLTIGFAGSHDILFSREVNEILKLPHHVLEIDPDEFGAISKKIRDTISTDNLSWNENCIAFYHVAKLANSLGLDTVVTANGIDELFCGYNGYRDAFKEGESKIMELMDSKLENELNMMKAVNLVSSEFSVKILQPLLSENFINYAKTVPVSEKILDPDDLMRKHIVRKLASQIGVPEISASKRKKALQYGSLIHKALIKSR